MDVTTQLESLRTQLRDAEASVARLSESAGDAAWVTRPNGGGWSAAECIAHLTLTTDAYLPLLDAARASVDAGAALPRKYKAGAIGWLLARTLEPPARARARTLPAFVPGGVAPRAETVASFVRSQRALLGWLDGAAAVPLNRVMVASPFNARLRYNAYAAYLVLASHQRRHIWQAERATRGIP
jgi:hypothetical protein